MFCIQESEPPHKDPFGSEEDPLSITVSESSDDEPSAKRIKTSYASSLSPSLNLKVYQIPAFNTQNSISMFPSTPTSLPKFVNNPLNLANPLALNNLNNLQNASNFVKTLHSRYSLPAKLTISPVQSPKPAVTSTGEVVRYKKNGEIAKKRGPPKGYKRKPKADLSQSFTGGAAATALLQAQNTILTSLLACGGALGGGGLIVSPSQSASIQQLCAPPTPVTLPPPPVPRVKVPPGVELVELDLDPEDWFPAEPYKMSFSRKKNPKWKEFPYRCEHCFKGYRVVSTLLTHAAERHGSVPKEFAFPCPCCGHVSTRKKQHKKHLESHASRKHRIFCVYCIPPPNPNEPYVKESERFPYDKYPQYWYASEESLRLHKKRKHPYAAMFNYNWFGTWGDSMPNS